MSGAGKLFEDLDIPLAAQIAEIRRELDLRASVYPRWIQSGKLKEHIANRQIAAMEAVLATLQNVRARQDDGK